MKDLKNKYKALPVEIVAIYKTKPTLGIAIQGGFDTNIKHPTVVHIQVYRFKRESMQKPGSRWHIVNCVLKKSSILYFKCILSCLLNVVFFFIK